MANLVSLQAESSPDAGSVTDWISAICSAVGAAVAVITVITVYVAARQLLTEHKAYQLGLAEDTLGPWHKKVKTKSLFGLQQQVSTPNITLPLLMKNNWRPTIDRPTEANCKPGGSLRDIEGAPAKASWVNFAEVLGIGPQDENLYHMSTQASLVNGIVPMRWEGKDLVGICTMLGYQSCEDKPSFKTPMPLPMQWSGPLGWLQFRPSADGCIVEFRRRGRIDNQLSPKLHDFYDGIAYQPEDHCLRSRLWRSINGMLLKNGKALYVGGADREDIGRTIKNTLQELQGKMGEFEGFLKKLHPGDHPTQETHANREMDNALFDELMGGDFSPEQIAQKLQLDGVNKAKPYTGKENKEETSHIPDFLQDIEKKVGAKEILMPCRGLLSTVVEGELAHSRGLNISDSVEYHRKFMTLEEADISSTKFGYNLGDLYMDDGLLPLFKEAMELLRPDGYYFTTTKMLAADVHNVYKHAEELTDKDHKIWIFPAFDLSAWNRVASSHRSETLHFAMMLCNEFQYIRKHNRATYTVGDMVAVAKASRSLRNLHQAPDLTWALLICPDLFNDLAHAFEAMTDLSAFNDSLSKPVRCQGGELDCAELMERCAVSDALDEKPASKSYKTPLCGDGEYSGSQMLAAFMDVLMTYYWTEKSWISDVGLYDTVIPPTITMC
ncbi:hypothetical protein QBC34DRAFT_325009 [Podospora aff. communis PSN243]|uniref:PH domain-containing protein n=1 Tax=Podospora aff. communis PSN243 TaxID=3040156 RepID=A0AAV9GQA7_9PEZI|nr:hypothetical protein QBC34DRAFT_325009 [Podospora aff. communis PSN243]